MYDGNKRQQAVIFCVRVLHLDDTLVTQEGEAVSPDSILSLPTKAGLPVFSKYGLTPDDPFLLNINRSGKKWVSITDEHQQPCMVLNANAFLRAAVFGPE